MDTIHRLSTWMKVAGREHWLPALLLAAPIMVAVWKPDSWWFLIVPITALIVGAVLRPHHVLVVWLASVVTAWIAVGVWELFNEPSPPANPENEETIVGFAIGSFVFTAVGVLLPLWIGKIAGRGAKEHLQQGDRSLGLLQIAREHWRPLLIVAPAIILTAWHPGPASIPYILLVPIVAAIAGFVLRPHHVWVIWVGSVIISWITSGITENLTDSDVLLTIAGMAVGVALPLWLARLYRDYAAKQLHGGDQSPKGLPS